MQPLQSNMSIDYVHYLTTGTFAALEAQPFYVNSPYGITLVDNINLTNADELRHKLFERCRRHLNTTSDSEILLNVLAGALDHFTPYPLGPTTFAALWSLCIRNCAGLISVCR